MAKIDEQPGNFKRKDSEFRHWITANGAPGPSGQAGFTPDKNRYHLYVSYACPWANRVLIMRNLKGLQDFFPYSIVHWRMGPESWHFEAEQGATLDPIMNATFAHELYHKANPNYSGVVTVPFIWDKQTQTIVSNESAEIIRMLNNAFDQVGARVGDYYPQIHRAQIDHLNQQIYDTVNNGVYRAGFATSQAAYTDAYKALFTSLNWLNKHLKNKDYLVGDQLTEADIRLFVTLIRFDVVYYSHFKCNQQHIWDYPELWRYTRALYARPEFNDTVNFYHIKHHYYESHKNLNPTGIVPEGPDIDFN